MREILKEKDTDKLVDDGETYAYVNPKSTLYRLQPRPSFGYKQPQLPEFGKEALQSGKTAALRYNAATPFLGLKRWIENAGSGIAERS